MKKASRRIRLRSIRLTDLPCFIRWWRDQEIRKLTSGSPRAPTERWIARRIVDMINPSQDIHRIILADGKPIGHCALIRRRGLRYEMQIVIGEPSMWNKGYGTLATQALVRLADRNGIHDIMLEVRPTNARAIRTFEKCGFLRSGYRRYPHNPCLSLTLIMRRNSEKNR